jgi:type IV secretory pathway VirB10-like protein
MKKIYPKVVVMRKSIIGAIISGALLIGILILFNMYHVIHKQKTAKAQTTIKSKAILVHNPEPYWYKNINGSKSEKVKSATIKSNISETSVETGNIVTEQQNIHGDSDYEKAKAAPISANQININLSSVITQSSLDTAISNNDSSQITDIDQNKQPEKTTFINNSARLEKHYLTETLQNPISPYEIKAGTIIPGVLITGINSELPGQIIGQIRSNIYDTVSGKYLLIPQGAKITGLYDAQIVYGQKRVLVAWKRIIFPNGQSIDLEGMPGVDLSGYAGFKDQGNNHYAKMIGSVVLLSVLGVGTELSQPQRLVENERMSINQVLAESLGTNIGNLAVSMTTKDLNIQPTLEIRPGYLFNINVTKDIVLSGGYSN